MLLARDFVCIYGVRSVMQIFKRLPDINNKKRLYLFLKRLNVRDQGVGEVCIMGSLCIHCYQGPNEMNSETSFHDGNDLFLIISIYNKLVK